jgi:hypothetical protein
MWTRSLSLLYIRVKIKRKGGAIMTHFVVVALANGRQMPVSVYRNFEEADNEALHLECTDPKARYVVEAVEY